MNEEEEVTVETVEMLTVFDKLRGELAARLHPAWDIAPDGMKFRAMPGDGPQDLNELAIWFHEAHPELSEAIDALEQ